MGEWEGKEITREREYGHQRATSLKDLVTKGAVIAITSGDPEEEYYLMQVTSGNGPEVLKKITKDNWSSSFRGHFYISNSQGADNRLNKLNKKKKAIVYAATARFICPDLPSIENANGKFFKVKGDLHLDILGSLEGF